VKGLRFRSKNIP